MAEAKEQEYGFELVGGRVCLDFVNTLNGSRDTGETEEKLTGYEELISWGRQAGLVKEREARELLREAARNPKEARAIIERARELREAIYRIISAATHDRAPVRADLAVLNGELARAMAQSEILNTAEGFVWDWSEGGKDVSLDRVLWPVARSAAELLTSEEMRRARVCEADDCTWLFMDLSKNRSRRWCDMKYCGNRAKSRRHYERKRSAVSN
ncbi:MAG TPA: ABATE domain-containing protein [Pyrinomonadaceae bacterium]|nr:ABATE domain-containing protein [Pyrinomonadaceae bacterium]